MFTRLLKGPKEGKEGWCWLSHPLLAFRTSGSYYHRKPLLILELQLLELPIALTQVIHRGKTRGGCKTPHLPKPMCLPTTEGRKMWSVSPLCLPVLRRVSFTGESKRKACWQWILGNVVPRLPAPAFQRRWGPEWC